MTTVAVYVVHDLKDVFEESVPLNLDYGVAERFYNTPPLKSSS